MARGLDDGELILFLHLHKAAGTSLVQFFVDQGLVLPPTHLNGNPWHEGYTELVEFWRYDAPRLAAYLDELRAQGVQLAACEWNFLPRDSRQAHPGVVWLTCLREPWARFVSCYFHEGGDEVFGSGERFYEERLFWRRPQRTAQTFPVTHNQPNHYVRVLNGLGQDHDATLTSAHLDEAKRVLELFDVVLVLEQRESFEQLRRFTSTTELPHANRGRAPHATLPESLQRRFEADNVLDRELYRFAQELWPRKLVSRPRSS